MKCFLTRAGAKIGRFFWSWGFLKFVLWAVTIIIFLYVEEDWRGARAWAATKAEWEAKGETFDLNKLTPPPIPDDQNLAAIPLFKLEPRPEDKNKDKTYLYPITLRRAMRTDLSGNDLPPRGNWMRGELPNMERIRFAVAANYAAAFKDMTPPQDILAQFDALYPFLTDLRAAAATRPFCRFNLDYTSSPPAGRALGLLVDQVRLSQILTLHAVLALDHHQPDLALEDIKVNCTLLSGAERNPTLVGGLVAIGMNAINGAAMYDGVATHAWSNAQLTLLQNKLAQIDFLSIFQFVMRSEAAEWVVNLDYFKRSGTYPDVRYFTGMSDTYNPVRPRFIPNFPGGWWDDNKRQLAALLLGEMTCVNPKAHLVSPPMADELEREVVSRRRESLLISAAPWNIWFTVSAGVFPSTVLKFSQAQVWVDEARIACALERYRLAHGVYPGALDALAPACIDELPHDIMNGEPYHYRLRPDGTYLLYSVGWNQKDDGGKVVYEKENPERIDYNHGDWVWPTPQLNP